MTHAFLYRALRAAEIEADCVLIPKDQGPFEANPRLGIDTRLPFALGPTEEHAVRQHQWQQNGFPTSGVSTTPHLERALFYAASGGVIVEIDRQLFSAYGVREYVVNSILGEHPVDIAVPEDDEVILVREEAGPFPKQLIVRVILLDSPKG
ncbi:MAG TPA: hypothetical protein VLE46_06395 [Nitrospira sp.]|jgi:hypothetical protein|nr:hypothetical protein [Nitrospira sp.]